MPEGLDGGGADRHLESASKTEGFFVERLATWGASMRLFESSSLVKNGVGLVVWVGYPGSEDGGWCGDNQEISRTKKIRDVHGEPSGDNWQITTHSGVYPSSDTLHLISDSRANV
ncbi:hypothetical protein J3459_014963 [Metarhizium acridum]|nr:hypothetical protein J3459_014963 [Metarhizium acridum]